MSDWRDPEILGSHEPALEQSTVKGGAGARARTLAVLLVVAVVGFLGLRAISDPAPVEDAEKSEVPEDVVEEPDTATSTTATSGTSTSGPSIPSTVVEGEPVFDHDTGWDLLVGGESRMQLIDLDSGSTAKFSTRGIPTGVVGDHLVFINLSDGQSWYTSVADVDGPRMPLGGTEWYGYWGNSLIRGDTETQVWLLAGHYERPRWALWDFAGPEPVVLQEVPAPVSFDGPPTHPLIFSASSGGVFAGVEGSTERVADGKVLAVTDDYVIVEQCGTPFDCPLVWLDLVDFSVADDIIPPPATESVSRWALAASPDGTYVYVQDQFDGESLLWNLKTGEAVSSSFFADQLSFSPDGKYVAGMTYNGRMEIMALGTGEVRRLSTVPYASGFYQVLFVPDGLVSPRRPVTSIAVIS